MKSASWVCIGGYTFCMKLLLWMLVLAAIGVIGYVLWSWRRNWLERQRAAEERFASFIVQAKPPAPPMETPQPIPRDATLPQQKLLLEAAAKAGEAGEPALAIQLYARLLARYPDSAFAPQARAAIEVQKQAHKQKLAKP
jgi:hypothetical protein